MNCTDPPSHPHTPPEHQPDHGEYCQCENSLKTRKCPRCNQWIGLGPKGGEWPFQQHIGSNSCTREKKRKELEAIHPVSKATSYANVVTPHPLPLTTPASLGPTHLFALGFHTTLPQQFIPSAPWSLANPPPLALGAYPRLTTLASLPSLGTSWSALSSPQICSAPSYSHIAPPSLTLEPKLCPQLPPAPPLAQKTCTGSLVLWEAGDPATTYPFTLCSCNLKGSTLLLWAIKLGECPGSLWLCSDECLGVSGPSQSCCQPCAGITSSTKYQQAEDRAKHDHKHRAYDKLNFEQLEGRAQEKGGLLAKE